MSNSFAFPALRSFEKYAVDLEKLNDKYASGVDQSDYGLDWETMEDLYQDDPGEEDLNYMSMAEESEAECDARDSNEDSTDSDCPSEDLDVDVGDELFLLGTAAERAAKLHKLAKKLMREGDHKKALTYCTQAIQLQPTNFVLYRQRSVVHAKFGDYMNAFLDAKKATDLKFDSRSSELTALGRLDSAIRFQDVHSAVKPMCRPANSADNLSLCQRKAKLEDHADDDSDATVDYLKNNEDCNIKSATIISASGDDSSGGPVKFASTSRRLRRDSNVKKQSPCTSDSPVKSSFCGRDSKLGHYSEDEVAACLVNDSKNRVKGANTSPLAKDDADLGIEHPAPKKPVRRSERRRSTVTKVELNGAVYQLSYSIDNEVGNSSGCDDYETVRTRRAKKTVGKKAAGICKTAQKVVITESAGDPFRNSSNGICERVVAASGAVRSSSALPARGDSAAKFGDTSSKSTVCKVSSADSLLGDRSELHSENARSGSRNVSSRSRSSFDDDRSRLSCLRSSEKIVHGVKDLNSNARSPQSDMESDSSASCPTRARVRRATKRRLLSFFDDDDDENDALTRDRHLDTGSFSRSISRSVTSSRSCHRKEPTRRRKRKRK